MHILTFSTKFLSHRRELLNFQKPLPQVKSDNFNMSSTEEWSVLYPCFISTLLTRDINSSDIKKKSHLDYLKRFLLDQVYLLTFG